jgi:hypothetical protein
VALSLTLLVSGGLFIRSLDRARQIEHLDNGNAFFPFRLAAFMTSLFGSMGLLLASIGLYGMIAYHVGQRTQEIGVRMALGARARDIIRDVLAEGGRFALFGIAIGIVLAAALARPLKGLLLGISPFDPLTYTAVAGLLVGICLLRRSYRHDAPQRSIRSWRCVLTDRANVSAPRPSRCARGTRAFGLECRRRSSSVARSATGTCLYGSSLADTRNRALGSI